MIKLAVALIFANLGIGVYDTVDGSWWALLAFTSALLAVLLLRLTFANRRRQRRQAEADLEKWYGYLRDSQ